MRGGAGRGEVRRPGRDGRCEAAGERRSGRDGRCEAAGERLMEMSALILGEIEGLRNVRELRDLIGSIFAVLEKIRAE